MKRNLHVSVGHLGTEKTPAFLILRITPGHIYQIIIIVIQVYTKFVWGLIIMADLLLAAQWLPLPVGELDGTILLTLLTDQQYD